MLYDKFERLDRAEDIIFIEDKIFNAIQIINQMIKYFKPTGNDLNFSCKDSFIKKYFKQKNVQGIFNRVEMKFCIKQGVKCELLMPSCTSKQKGYLEIRVIIDFSQSRKQFKLDESYDSRTIEDNKSLENLDVKVSLDFCPEESEVEEISENEQSTPALNNLYWMANQYK